MRILFYVEPQTELDMPFFKLNSICMIFPKIMRQFDSSSHSMELVCSEVIRNELIKSKVFPPRCRISYISEEKLKDIGAPTNLERDDLRLEQITQLQSIFSSAIFMENPDIIFVWESASHFLKHIFPEAVIIYLTPGLFSRQPFPYTLCLDFDGMFRNASFAKDDYLDTHQLVDEDYNFYESVYNHYIENRLKSCQLIRRIDFDPKFKFKKYLLVPLQVSNYFAYNSNSSYKTQKDFLLDILEKSPADTGIVVTPYKTSFVSDSTLYLSDIKNLQKDYSNLLCPDLFYRLPSVSQYLLHHISGTVSVSSAVGLLTAMLNKPLWCAGNSHLIPFAQPEGLSGVGDFSSTIQINNISRLAALFTYNYFIPQETIYNKDWLKPRIIELAQNKAHRQCWPQIFCERSARYRSLFLTTYDTTKYFIISCVKKGIKGSPANFQAMDDENKMLSSEDIEAVSFDVFDTLIQRPLMECRDVFLFMEPKVFEITQNRIANFSQLRPLMASLALEDAASQNKEDINIDEIYNTFVALDIFTPSEAQQIKDLEIATEKQILIPREQGVRLYNKALSLGKKIFIISDMYLHKTIIESLLHKNGITQYDGLYVSSEYKYKKSSGRLYDIFLKDIQIDPAHILHIGDNFNADIHTASSKGLRTYHIPRAADLIQKNSILGPIFKSRYKHYSRYDRACLGLLAASYFSDSTTLALRQDSISSHIPYDLGYMAIGVFLTGFAIWLARRASQDGVKDLFFLSRDGEILKKAFDIIKDDIAPQISTHYLLSSRKACIGASLYNISDIINAINIECKEGTFSEYIHQKFDLDFDRISSIAQKYNISADTIINPEGFAKQYFQLIHEISPLILDIAASKRELYQTYLQQMGFMASSSKAIVDVGFSGRLQKGLARLSADKKLGGYYIATFEQAEFLHAQGLPVAAFYDNFISRSSKFNKVTTSGINLTLFELLTLNGKASFTGVSKDENGVLKFDFNPSSCDAKTLNLMQEIHRGAIDFCTDFAGIFTPYFDQLALNSDDIMEICLTFLKHPSYKDASLFEGCIHENTYANAKIKYIVPPAKSDTMQYHENPVWTQGTAVLYEQEKIVRKTKLQCKLQKLEYIFIKKFCDENKFRKYEKDREAYYKDSKNIFLKLFRKIYNFQIIYPVEYFFIRKYCSKNKQLKYKLNRALFFSDASNKFLQKWGKFTQKFIDS